MVRGIIQGGWINRGWVFGGYLQEELPEDAVVVIGAWDVAEDDELVWLFSAENSYIHGIKNSGSAVRGTWTLEGGVLTLVKQIELDDLEPWQYLQFTEESIPMEEIELTEWQKRKQTPEIINLQVNSRNDIVLNFPDGEISHLKRNDKY
jgi:hypothetical protein